MYLKPRQYGSGLSPFIIFIAVVAVIGWLVYSGVADETSATVAGGTGFFAGLLAGGWFVATGAGAIAETFLWLLVLGPAIAMFILSERGDPRSSLWWEEDDRRDATSYEITVSLVCVVTLFLLDYGGIPIWDTIANATWPIQAAGVTAYVIIGIGWGMLRWDDLSAHLHRRRGNMIRDALDQARKMFSQLLQHEGDIRKKFRLAESDPLPTDCADGDIRLWGKQYAHLATDTDPFGNLPPSLNQLHDLVRNHSRDLGQAWKSFLAQDQKNEKFRDGIPTDFLRLWIADLEASRYPPELNEFLQEYERKWIASVSAGDYKGQIYLWTVFWPWSMGFRILRKILTLKLLRDIFVFMFNRLRFIYDRIAARHEVKFEMVTHRPEWPTFPESTEKVMPIRQQAEKGDLI